MNSLWNWLARKTPIYCQRCGHKIGTRYSLGKTVEEHFDAHVFYRFIGNEHGANEIVNVCEYCPDNYNMWTTFTSADCGSIIHSLGNVP